MSTIPTPLVAIYLSQVIGLITPFEASVDQTFQMLEIENLSQREAVIKIYNFTSGSDFTYVLEVDKDNWNTPAIFLKTKTGDCEEFSSLNASLFYRAGILNYMVFSQGKPGANWKQIHVANLVMLADNSFLYLDSSYPHAVGELPFYQNEAEVFNVLSLHSPLAIPVLSFNPQPLTTFMQNIPLLKLLNFQI